MAARTTEAGSARRRFAVAAAFACLATSLVAVGATSPADAVRAKEIGKTKKSPNPSCPTPNTSDPPAKKICKALGRVTGFQAKGDGRKGLMRIPENGRIVAWGVDLAKPNKEERAFFEAELNGDPRARLAMLTHADKKKYRLRAQSPEVNLDGLLGRRQYLTLRNPIAVKKGWIAALTTTSWVPNLAHDLAGGKKQNVWKGSRTRKRCTRRKDLLERSRPHKGVGSTRAYGCTYTDRLLYWAYFVPNN
jgi:hypothetical protein